MNTPHEPIDNNRRALMLGIVAATLLGKIDFALATSLTDDINKDVAPQKKYALVIGNRDYPGGKDLPPAHKNVTDIKDALEFFDFNVTAYSDLHAENMGGVLTKFSQDMQAVAKDSPPDSMIVIFYFCGHGFQSAGENYLVPAGIDLSSESALKKSFKLKDDVTDKLKPFNLHPEGSGITIALIDACRTDPNVKRGVDDFNQIIVPDGTIVFFATRAGRPALAPDDEKRNTYFTGSLVAALQDERIMNGKISIDDVFNTVRDNCFEQVSQEFKKAEIPFPAQWPEITSGKSSHKYVILNKRIEEGIKIKIEKIQTSSENEKKTFEEMEKSWAIIQQTILPGKLIKLCEKFKNEFPDSEYAPSLKVVMNGAKKAKETYQAAKLSADSLEDSTGNAEYRIDLIKALRGDKDATYRIAFMYRGGTNGLKQNIQRTERWLAFSAELGNGIACWELSEIYSLNGQTADQAKYEKLAIELGYTPPARLKTTGY